MKILRAEFQNFRLLRDLELSFAADPVKKLTVIRAANESGKTTILHALQWALYGDDALPGKGEGFRLHPIDWDAASGKRVPIMATIEFELATYRKGQESRRRYRLIRSAFEEVDTTARRAPSTVKLFALTDIGSSPIENPESFIDDELPPELRDVFFTDGDRALSFIEADVAVSAKRERVQRAIRSLLGLQVIEDALRHVRRTAADVNKQAKQIGANGELNKVATRLEGIEDEIAKLEAQLDDSKQQFSNFEEKIEEKDKQIAAALQKGDKEKLANDLNASRRRIKQIDDQQQAAAKEHSALFRSRSLGVNLLEPLLVSAFAKLQELHDQHKIPNTTIPVLEDRLASEICICGETLAASDPGGQRRRGHIQRLMDDSRQADDLQSTLTTLYFEGKSLQPPDNADRPEWLEDYEKVLKSRDGLKTMREEAGREYRGLEAQLAAIPDTDVQGLRDFRRQYKEQRDRCLTKKAQYETQLAGLRSEKEQLSGERDRLLRDQKKGARILAQLQVTQDVMGALQCAFERITKDELTKVSDLMNRIFLEMIGAEPEQGAIIRRAEISPEFDIKVYGPSDRALNPDRDLNGASRRALSLSFILALTKVSEVEAPNVIDTPLGMTSGYVKRSILRTAIRESTQLVLFLTHDEVAGCEDIIDEAAGAICTLTNPAHYPKMLVNKPTATERKVLSCDCDHRKHCPQCHRRTDAEVELDVAI